MADFSQAILLDPKNVYAVVGRALTTVKLKHYADAGLDFEKAAKLGPTIDSVWRSFAFFRATCPEASYRDGKKALEMAKKAVELAGKGAGWEHFASLAAAHAELAQFDEAVAEQTKVLADKSFDKDERKKQEQRLELFKKKQPYRDVD
jgi:tetratricopeptide (TPR) repeat protein